jgi:Transcriptional repressor NrdR-like, N-terminal domain
MTSRLVPRGLTCSCGSNILAVKDSRATLNAVRRRRKCLNCGLKFTTFEIMAPIDAHRLYDALHFYDQLQAMPAGQREAVETLLVAFTPVKVDRRFQPQIGHQPPAIAVDAGEEAPYG